jgi:hypothetical protein
MIHNFVSVLGALVLATSGLMTFVSFIVMMIGLFQCAARRCDGVSYFAAVASKNIIYRPELYTEEAASPRRLHKVGLVGTILFPFVAISVGAFLKWIVR